MFIQLETTIIGMLYTSGAQRPARGPHPAHDKSSCGPQCPTRNKWPF